MGITTRELALDILMQVMEEGEYSHIALRNTLASYQYLEKKDRSFLTRICEGTIEYSLTIDYILNCFSKLKVKKMKPVIRNILRMGVYQIIYMDQVPDRAACNEAVTLAEKKGPHGLKGFVNGVLRNIAREKEHIAYPDREREECSYFSVKYSMPEWIVRQWRTRYSAETVEAMLASMLSENRTTIWYNSKKTTKEKLKEILKEEQAVVIDGEYLSCAMQIKGYNYLNALSSFQNGLFFVQDESSMLAVLCAGIKKGDTVIDVCSAPGGKSLFASELLQGSGQIKARDITDYKVDFIKENIERMGVQNIQPEKIDALMFLTEEESSADIVIADLPCSGLGVIGKKSDIKYKMTEEKQMELAKLQMDMLEVVCRYVKPGGTLLYTTCTISQAENENNYKSFLQTHPEFQADSLEPFLFSYIQDETEKSGYLQLLPGIHKTDGFFIGRMKRMEKKEIQSYNLEEMTEFVREIGEKPFRAKQIYQWIHIKHAASIDEMTDLSKDLREKLKQTTLFSTLHMVDQRISEIDGTRKYLFQLSDGAVIESVWMQYKHGNSVCISSQAGCRMGCRFCASTIDGLERNLLPSEMLSQVYRIEEITGERVSNVVVMGSGEPLDNYDHLIRFLELLTDENGLHISQRNITVSTCGLVEGIRKLAEEGLAITLALSLHAPNDTMRRSLMPIANKYSIQEVLNACIYYYEKTGRRLTFEYSLVQGVNDSPEAANELSALVKGLNCHINLIPVNPVKEREYKQSDNSCIQKFKKNLEKNRINVTIRREMGQDIDAACGQLRKSYIRRK